MEQVQIAISHELSSEQLQGIYQSVYEVTTQAIKDARRDSKIDNDLMYSKAELRRFLNDCSDGYVEELLAKGLPKGRSLSERKTVFSKRAIETWLLENDEEN